MSDCLASVPFLHANEVTHFTTTPTFHVFFFVLSLQVAWSATTVCGQALSHVLPLSSSDLNDIANYTRDKATSIIAAKGFTSFGVAAATTTLCESIIYDQRQVLPVSHWLEDHGCCLSIPATIGRTGVVSTLPFKLEKEEAEAFEKSAKSVRKVMESCEQYF